MRNYELLRVIHEELVQGNGKGSFSNPYLNTVIKLTRLIEEERPEMKEITQSEKRTKRPNFQPATDWAIPTDEVSTPKSNFGPIR